MFIIDCLPLSKGLSKESLSYFGAKYLAPGSLVKINIRNKNVSALVLESRDVSEAKSEIKSANFQLKKITGLATKPFLQKEFLEAVKITARYFSTNSGSVLFHLIPSFILENPNLLSVLKEEKINLPVGDENNQKKVKSEVAILQAPDEERLTLYKSLIREEFAKNRSVFMCLPQNENVKQAREKLERGIESFVCSFHNDISKKDLTKEWKKACQTPHPVLIISTAKWLFIPRKDFGTIIIDKENESGWKTFGRPFMDLRFFAETLANKKNIRAVIGDSFLRTETLYRYKQGEIAEFESVKWRVPLEVKTELIDLRVSTKKEKSWPSGAGGQEFKTLSPELLEVIKDNVLKGSNMFIFAVRKGMSATTICRDCGEQVKCGNCSAPMILYKTHSSVGEGGAFKCHQCGETRDAAEVCQNCGSWKLAAFGAGIDRVAEEIRKNIPNVNLFEIHKDVTESNAEALNVSANFYATRGGILLGTEMAFSYLYKKVGSSAIASLDSLFSIPDFRIREKIFRLILQTRDLAKENFLIQTRSPEDLAIEFAVSGNLIEFYKKEIADRAVLDYPPFGIFIKITARGAKNFVAKETENLKRILKNHNPIVFLSTHEKKGEPAAVNAVIKLPNQNWPSRDHFLGEMDGPQNDLLNIIKSLPSYFEIKVDPDNLL